MTAQVIPEAAIEAGLGAWAVRGGLSPKGIVRNILEAAAPHMLDQVAPIIRDLIDSDDCWFDHAGGCQAHGYISLQPGEICPQADAKEWVKAHG